MSNYEVNVLVNGARVKIYNHEGKKFVQANPGSNYVLEIKNNSFNRVLAVSSVDSLNVLTGKFETDDGPGYVVNCLNSVKIDGFRVSDKEVAQFKFDIKSKNESFAASKKDDKNVGVIGVRLFNEKTNPNINIEQMLNDKWNCWCNPPHTPIWSTYTSKTSMDECLYSGNINEEETTGNPSITNEMSSSKTFNVTSNLQNNISEKALNQSQYSGTILRSTNEPRGFDAATTFGEAKESKVIEVEFERGTLSDSINIYYATRKSLIEMGIPITNEKQVAFPEPFKDNKYCEPPKNWKK